MKQLSSSITGENTSSAVNNTDIVLIILHPSHSTQYSLLSTSQFQVLPSFFEHPPARRKKIRAIIFCQIRNYDESEIGVVENHANLNIAETSVKDFNSANKIIGKVFLEGKVKKRSWRENKLWKWRRQVRVLTNKMFLDTIINKLGLFEFNFPTILCACQVLSGWEIPAFFDL